MTHPFITDEMVEKARRAAYGDYSANKGTKANNARIRVRVVSETSRTRIALDTVADDIIEAVALAAETYYGRPGMRDFIRSLKAKL